MNRRAFLSTLTAAAVGFTLDPEFLLWKPGEKAIFIPSGIVTPKVFITPEWIARDVAMFWKNNLKLMAAFDQGYDRQWEGASVGLVVRQRIPQHLRVI